MATIQHGRRKGHSRDGSRPASSRQEPGLVISRTDYERMRKSLEAPQKAKSELLAEERRKLHEMSQQSVAGWQNTIAGQRQRRLAAREKRLAEEEARRVELDAEEDRYRQEQRQAVVDRAKQIQYSQDDRVKGFQTALLEAEVLAERKAQAAKLNRRADVIKQHEEMLLQYQKEDLSAAEEAEARKKADAREAALSVAEEQLKQASLKTQQRRKEYEEYMKASAEIRAQALEAEAQDKAKQHQRKREQQEFAKLMDEQRREQQQFKAKAHEEETQLDEEIRQYIDHRDQVKELQRAKYGEKLTKGEQLRATVRDTVYKQTMARDDSERITKAQEEILRREDQRYEAERRKREQDKRDMLEYNAGLVQRRRDEARQAKEQAAREREELQASDREFLEAEQQKAERRRRERLDLQSAMQSQIDDKKAASVFSQTQRGGDHQNTIKQRADEDEQFRRYALQKVKELEASGLDTGPALRALGRQDRKPRSSAPKQGKAWTRAPGNPAPGNTTKRLGFTWVED
eukprot:m.24694 g.24694  ORF g.24694 m.24694 type:complete len:518 (+) comp7571_c0_seq1:374-1927(+)